MNIRESRHWPLQLIYQLLALARLIFLDLSRIPPQRQKSYRSHPFQKSLFSENSGYLNLKSSAEPIKIIGKNIDIIIIKYH